LHGFAERLGDQDLKAIMQFVLITCIVLPVLPHRTVGPFNVLNPFEIWLLVVLIVGINLGGYIAYKFLGAGAGALLGGILGGIISSTAATVSYSRQALATPALAQNAAVVILIATGISFLRVLVLIGVVSAENPDFIWYAAIPLIALAVLSLIPAALAWRRAKQSPGQMPEQKNPTQLRSAIFFAAMYAVVLLALAVAKDRFPATGHGAMYAVAAISGLTDLDAITLSTTRLAQNDPGLLVSGWRLIVVAALANLVFKAIAAGLLGGRRFFAKIAAFFAIPMLGGILILLLC
jgi:uncharacterized membrane protein (DUF4010 family)